MLDVVKMSLETAAEFLELFEDNINLMGHESQELLKPLQITYHQWRESDCEYFKPYDFAKAFLLLTDQLFEEYNVLCVELGLPAPAKANYFYKERNNDH